MKQFHKQRYQNTAPREGVNQAAARIVREPTEKS